MEEQILKIIRQHFYNVDGTPEKSAYEIAQHITGFIEWAISGTAFQTMTDSYYILDAEWECENIDELYNYYIENVLNKAK